MPLDEMGRTVDRTYDFNSAINDRWKPIDAIGDSQNNYENEAAQRRMALKQQQDSANMANAQQEGQDAASSQTSGGGGGDNFQSFLSAISGQESGGSGYKSVNKTSGAMGKYQVMPSNINGAGGWDKEALGHDITSAQFMADPKMQEKIAQFKLQKYYNKYGAAGAAVAWYAGPSTANNYMKSGGKGFNGSEGNYPTVSAYAQQILRRMNASTGGGGAEGTRGGNGAVNFAKSMQGTPYQWGGTSSKGFDCSGLVQSAFSKMSIKMPRTSQEQARMGTVTSINNLGKGDLVAWGSSPGTAHHIAIYAGNGMIWESPHTGASVRLRKISSSERGIMGINLR